MSFNELSTSASHELGSASLSKPVSMISDNDLESESQNVAGGAAEESSKQPERKKNACTLCRTRKLKCGGENPACATCTRLKRDCVYPESRRKSGPRRGRVESLQKRLAQAEELIKKYEASERNRSVNPNIEDDGEVNGPSSEIWGYPAGYLIPEPVLVGLEPVSEFIPYQSSIDAFPEVTLADTTIPLLNAEFSWDMIELGVEEPLPLQEIIDELNEIYFSKIHPSTPIIHQYRFMVAMNLSSRARPSVAVRYAMWALAAFCTEKYRTSHSYFYARARKYAEADEVAGRQRYLTLRHAQAFILIAIYEFKMMIFPNAWLTTGRATRLTQMMGLYRLDGLGLDVKQSLPMPMDWNEKEERRRTFWMAFSMDRCASVGTGWPMVVDERDVLTDLPSSEEAFHQNVEEAGISLTDAMNPTSASKLSAFSGSVLIASLSGQILQHLQRPYTDADEEDLNGTFWRSHRKMDNILLNISLHLPSHLRLPAGSSNPNTIFLNMSLQAAIICLHQAAIFKAEKLDLPVSIIADSKNRCVAAATEIASIMRMVAHFDLALLNVYTPFSLYVATRIFAHISKLQPDDDIATTSVRFLLSALVAIKESNPLAESYLVQLDLEGTGLASLQENATVFSNLAESVSCITIKDDTAESSWVTFVSPLVRIVKQTEESVSPPSDSQRGLGGNKSTNTTGSTRDATSDMESFPSTETWNMEDTGMSTDYFDPSMNFGTNG